MQPDQALWKTSVVSISSYLLSYRSCLNRRLSRLMRCLIVELYLIAENSTVWKCWRMANKASRRSTFVMRFDPSWGIFWLVLWPAGLFFTLLSENKSLMFERLGFCLLVKIGAKSIAAQQFMKSDPIWLVGLVVVVGSISHATLGTRSLASHPFWLLLSRYYSAVLWKVSRICSTRTEIAYSLSPKAKHKYGTPYDQNHSEESDKH